MTKEQATRNLIEFVDGVVSMAYTTGQSRHPDDGPREWNYDDVALDNRIASLIEAVTAEVGDLKNGVIPDIDATIGDFIAAKGALFDAASTYVDWEDLHAGKPDAVSTTGKIILALANALPGGRT